MLSTAAPAEVPDERQILTSQLTTPTAADYLLSAPPLSLSVTQTANRLGTFLMNWNLLTTDQWILQAVSGYKIPFLRPPHQWWARPTVVREGQPTELMKGAIQSLISKGAISVVNPCPQQFISTLFLVEKGQGMGEFRPVINLKALNRFLPKEKFKMEGLHTACSLPRKGDYMMKLDLKSEGIPEGRHAATTLESGPPSPASYPSGNGQYNCRCLCEQVGGTQSPSLSLLALELWSFLLTQGSWVTARHLPGVLNVEADVASREFNTRTEWMLRQDVFQDIAHHFYVPEIVLFASRLNHQLPLYVSRLPDPSASAVDAFQQNWSQWKSFIHPPVVLLPRILQKVRSDKATALLVAPD